MIPENGQLWRHRTTGTTLKVVHVNDTDVCLDAADSVLHVIPADQLELSWGLLA